MRGNTITVRLSRGRIAHTGDLFQYDKGQWLILTGCELPVSYKVHFSNDETGQSKAYIGTSEGVQIPDEYLATGKNVYFWVYVVGEDHAETEYRGVINVIARAEPTNETPTPEQITLIEQAITALNEATEETERVAGQIAEDIDSALTTAKESGEFDGPKGDDGFSPVISVEDITGGHRVTILDASGEPKTIDVLNGITPTVPVQDVQVNGESILSQGIANIPYAGTDVPGVVKVGAGLSLYNGTTLIVNPAGEPKIKQGTSSNLPITPLYLPEAAFYALARLAGYNLNNSNTPVGTYPPEALVAIQKMLGLYEAPWELIRDVEFTNATEGDYLIDVDKDGNPFELVDIRGVVWIPAQNNEAKLANGVVYVLNGSSVISQLAVDLKTVAANSAECGAYFMLEQKNGMMFHQTTGWCNVSVMGQVRMTLRYDDITTTPTTTYPFKVMAETAITAIQMRKLTGTFKIRLYGRRKWRT